MQEIIVYDDKDGANPKLHRGCSLCVSEALVKRVSPLVLLRDGAKDSEIFNLERLLLHLNHVAKALGQTAPHHVEEAESLALLRLKRCIDGRRGSVGGVWRRCRIPDEGQVELGEVAIEEARVMHALFEECEFREGSHGEGGMNSCLKM